MIVFSFHLHFSFWNILDILTPATKLSHKKLKKHLNACIKNDSFQILSTINTSSNSIRWGNLPID